MSARKEKKEKEKESVKNLRLGMELLSAHNFFGSYHVAKNTYGKKALGRKTAIVTRGDRRGYSQCVELDINEDMLLSPQNGPISWRINPCTPPSDILTQPV